MEKILSMKKNLQIEKDVFFFLACCDGDLLQPNDWSDLSAGVFVFSGRGFFLVSALWIGAGHGFRERGNRREGEGIGYECRR